MDVRAVDQNEFSDRNAVEREPCTVRVVVEGLPIYEITRGDDQGGVIVGYDKAVGRKIVTSNNLIICIDVYSRPFPAVKRAVEGDVVVRNSSIIGPEGNAV